MSWWLKRKLVESIEYADARFMQQVVILIEGSTQVRLYCWRYYLNIYSYIQCNTESKTVIFQLQDAKLNFPKFCKVYVRQNQKTNLIYLHIRLVEAIALNLHSKLLSRRLKLFIRKNTLHALNPLIAGGNERSYILK